MKIIVQKFGGTSVATPQLIKHVANRVVKTKKAGWNPVVVVSAMGDTTDRLIELAHQVSANPDRRELDMLLATGEQVSIALLAMAIKDLGYDAISFTGFQAGIITTSTHTKAKIEEIKADRVLEAVKQGKIPIVAGFQGITESEDITTLGRGGSDTTAVALAAALKAELCEIYTDVPGVFTADPRIVPEAVKLKEITYDEMLELARLGAKVLQSRSVEFAKKYDVVLCVRSTFSEESGTIVKKGGRDMEKSVIRGVAQKTDEIRVTIKGVPDRPGVAATIFEDLASAEINVDLIVQSSSTQKDRNDISFTISKDDLSLARPIMENLVRKLQAEGVDYDENIAIVSIVGVGMRSQPGIAAKMFRTLANLGINIEMISTSEITLSCVIAKDRAAEATRALHKAFELEKLGVRE